jgi:hypothetical protein
MSDKKKPDDATFDEPAATVPPDLRPRFGPIECPIAGSVRMRRLEPEQIYAQIKHFMTAGIKTADLKIENDAQRAELCRLIQRCVVPPDSNNLLYPGHNGWLRLAGLRDDKILAMARTVIQFQEL